jgi:hypothetical protein
VAVFYRKCLTSSCTFSPIHSISSYHSIGLDVTSSSFHLHLINFYHHVPSSSHSFEPLLLLPLDPHIPTLIAGDFNTHSLFWSIPPQASSPWAPVLEEWIDRHNLFLTVPDGSITWQNTRHHSFIDLLFVNAALFDFPLSPSTCEVSFSLTFGSDHAGLLYSFPLPLPHSLPSPRKGWIIDDLKHDDWVASIRAIPTPTITSIADAHHAADELNTALRFTADMLFDKRRPNLNGKYPWWNESCRQAAAAVANTSGDTRTQNRLLLRKTLRDAKRSFFESLLTDSSTPIWDVAKWRHGRRETLIHPISDGDNLVLDFNSMTQVFKKQFFDISAGGPTVSTSQALSEVPNMSGTASTVQLQLENGAQVLQHLPALRVNLASGCPRSVLSGALLQTDNRGGPPPPENRRPFFCVTEDEVRQALSPTSNKSAPGPSGITYKLLKWMFEANPGLIIATLNGALEHGTHPWGTADVVVIPKPHKPDYSLAKAYRPISLLECTGKLLEKVVANRLGTDKRNHQLIGHSQFGSQKYHSAPDAATLL